MHLYYVPSMDYSNGCVGWLKSFFLFLTDAKLINLLNDIQLLSKLIIEPTFVESRGEDFNQCDIVWAWNDAYNLLLNEEVRSQTL